MVEQVVIQDGLRARLDREMQVLDIHLNACKQRIYDLDFLRRLSMFGVRYEYNVGTPGAFWCRRGDSIGQCSHTRGNPRFLGALTL